MAALNATKSTILFILYAFLFYSKKVWIYPKNIIKLRVSREVSVYNTYLCTWRTKKKLNFTYFNKEFPTFYGILSYVSISPGSASFH